jgi:(S)-sulfolactate dehydrogenase
VGLDNIDVAACESRGIEVIPATGANAESVAELRGDGGDGAAARRLLLDARRRGGDLAAADAFRRGAKPRARVIGIVGFGSIGRLTALKAGALGRRCSRTIRRSARTTPRGRRRARGAASSPRCWSRATSSPCTSRLPPRRAGLLDEDRLSRMKRDAVVINTRAAASLTRRRWRGCCARAAWAARRSNVFDDEPLPRGSPLVGAPRLLLTPHIAGVTLESNERVSALIADAWRGTGPI